MRLDLPVSMPCAPTLHASMNDSLVFSAARRGQRGVRRWRVCAASRYVALAPRWPQHSGSGAALGAGVPAPLAGATAAAFAAAAASRSNASSGGDSSVVEKAGDGPPSVLLGERPGVLSSATAAGAAAPARFAWRLLVVSASWAERLLSMLGRKKDDMAGGGGGEMVWLEGSSVCCAARGSVPMDRGR